MKSLLIVKNKGTLIPTQYLERAVKHHSQALGLAFVDKTGGENLLVTDTTGIEGTSNMLETINNVQTELQDSEVIFHLLSKGKGVDDDIQPYTLLKNSKSEPEMVVFLAGNFEHHVASGSDRPGEFMAYGGKILPIVQELYEDVGKDINKLVDKMERSSIFKTAMEQLYRDSGTICFLTCNEDLFSFGSNIGAKMFEWGKVTSHFDYTESGVTTGKQVVETQRGKIASFLGKNAKGETSKVGDKPATAVPDTKAVQEQKISEVTETKEELTSSTTPPPVVGQSGPKMMARPPEKLRSSNSGKRDKNAIKNWYRFCSTAGKYPKGWADFVEVECWEKRVKSWDEGVRQLKDFKDITTETKVVSTPTPSDAPKVEAVKHDTAPKHVSPENKKVDVSGKQVAVSANVPIMSAEELENWKQLRNTDSFKKVLDASSRVIPNPSTLQEKESKFVTIFNQLGIKPSQMYNWGTEQFEEFGQLVGIGPLAMLCAGLNYRVNMLLGDNPNDINDTTTKEVGAIPDVVKTEKKVEIKQEPVKKTGGFGRFAGFKAA